jgi:hypothetical protein
MLPRYAGDVQKILTGLLLVASTALATVAFQADNHHDALWTEQDRLGLRFGCSEEYPIPASAKPGEWACYKREACDLWSHPPTCSRLTMHPEWFAAWKDLQAQRDSLGTRTSTCGVLAFLLGYLVVGWYAHSLVLAILLRFMLRKWALLVSVAVDAGMINAVGVIRAITGLLKLPPHESAAARSIAPGA